MLPAQNRMTSSTEFAVTVGQGTRAAQPNLVVYTRSDGAGRSGPRIGLVVSKAVGNAVQRHRVSRRLRHVARTMLEQLGPADRMVIRALPSSRHAPSTRLEHELRTALQRIELRSGEAR